MKFGARHSGAEAPRKWARAGGLLGPLVPNPPPEADWHGDLILGDMLGFDLVGDCVPAAWLRQEQIWRSQTHGDPTQPMKDEIPVKLLAQ